MDVVTRPGVPSPVPVIAGAGTPERDWQQWAGWSVAPTASCAELLATAGRLVVVAPHPDDETLAAGGLIYDAVDAGHELLLIAVTDGGASHPGSSRWPAGELIQQRDRERVAALAQLGISVDAAAFGVAPSPAASVELVRIGLLDGQVTESAERLTQQLTDLLRPSDVVIAPWLRDGHPDHEATTRAVLGAAAERGCTVLQAPIWGWHWASPAGDELPIAQAVVYPLSVVAAAAKRRAVACFVSQLEPDLSTGAEPVLADWALARWLRDREVFLR